MKDAPNKIPSSRICVLRYSDEVVICSNIAGLKSIGLWMQRLADSNPKEAYHFHLLWELESDECKFDGVLPKNIWFLAEAEHASKRNESPDGTTRVEQELTFQVVTEETLDELAEQQKSGLIPESWLKDDSSYEVNCK